MGEPALGRLRPAVGLALLVGVLALAALSGTRPAVLALGGLAFATAFVLTLFAAPHRLTDVLYVGLLLCAAIPLDKYFGYRPHVGGWPGLRVALADIFVVLLVPIAVARIVLGRLRPALPAALCIPYALLLLQYGISVAGAERRDLGLFEMASAVHALVVAAVVATLFQRRYVGAVLAVVAFLVVLHTGFAVAQAATGRPIGTGIFGGRSEVMQESLVSGAVRLRPSGLFDHPIVYADFILVSLPLLAAGVGLLRRGPARAAMVIVFLVGLTGLVLTLARGAWSSAVVAAIAAVLLGLRLRLVERATLRRALLPAAILLLLVVLPFGRSIYERLTESQKGNLRVRFELNEIALSMVRAHPMAGVGLSNFIPVMHHYDPKNVMRYFPATVHNLYLLEASEAGIPGLILFVASAAGLLYWSWLRLPAIEDPALQWIAVAIVAGLVGFGASQLADFSHRLEPLRTVLWTYAGLLVGAVRVGVARPVA